MGERIYYVYEWYVVETLEVFYVGMGHGDRMFCTNERKRNELFNDVMSKNKCDVRIHQFNLAYDYARARERKRIAELKEIGQAFCNLTPGGERTNGKKISERLKGRTLSEEHRKNLSLAAKRQWQEHPMMINNKSVAVLDDEFKLVKQFEAKYQVGIWLHELGYGKNSRTIQRVADKYFKSKKMFDNKFYFVE